MNIFHKKYIDNGNVKHYNPGNQNFLFQINHLYNLVIVRL